MLIVVSDSLYDVDVLAFAEWEEIVYLIPYIFIAFELIFEIIDADSHLVQNRQKLFENAVSLLNQLFIVSAKGFIAVSELSNIEFVNKVCLLGIENMLGD